MLSFNSVPTYNDLKSHYPAMKAALWDMDGTLLDSESIHMDTMLEMLDIQGELTSEQTALRNACVGLTENQVLDKLQTAGHLKQYQFDDFIKIKDKKFELALEKFKIEQILSPSVIELLNEFKRNGIKMAIVTSAERAVTDLLMKKTNLLSYFDFVLTKQDVQKPKPDPNPYYMAMEKLNISAPETLIFEDSTVGLSAAKASGANYLKACWYTK